MLDVPYIFAVGDVKDFLELICLFVSGLSMSGSSPCSNNQFIADSADALSVSTSAFKTLFSGNPISTKCDKNSGLTSYSGLVDSLLLFNGVFVVLVDISFVGSDILRACESSSSES